MRGSCEVREELLESEGRRLVCECMCFPMRNKRIGMRVQGDLVWKGQAALLVQCQTRRDWGQDKRSLGDVKSVNSSVKLCSD